MEAARPKGGRSPAQSDKSGPFSLPRSGLVCVSTCLDPLQRPVFCENRGGGRRAGCPADHSQGKVSSPLIYCSLRRDVGWRASACGAGERNEVGGTHGEKTPVPVLPVGQGGTQDDAGNRTRWLWRAWASRMFLSNKISQTETSSHRPLSTNTAQHKTKDVNSGQNPSADCFLSLVPQASVCSGQQGWASAELWPRGHFASGRKMWPLPASPQPRAFSQSLCPRQWGKCEPSSGPPLVLRALSAQNRRKREQVLGKSERSETGQVDSWWGA